jgi:predicted dehydrogenase
MEHGMAAFFESIQGAGSTSAGFGLQLIGTEGIIDMRADQEPVAQLLAGSPFIPTPAPRPWAPITSAGLGKPEPVVDIRTAVSNHVLPARDLIASIRENRQPLCSGEDARVTIEMIMAVFESHRESGARVKMPLKNRENPLRML